MSAEVLRRAAALMRERTKRTEAADSITPWRAIPSIDPENDGWVVVNGSDGDYDTTVCRTPYDYTGGSAEHIASWHPAVALAVADWLEAVATAFGLPVPPGLPSDKGEVWTSSASAWAMPGSVVSAALAVARAYLGESP